MSCAVITSDAPCILTEHNIILPTVVGVYEWERVAERELIFDVQIEGRLPPNISRALIEQRLRSWLTPCRYRLLEALAEHLCARILSEWSCSRVILGIEKPGALGDIARVGIRISRGN